MSAFLHAGRLRKAFPGALCACALAAAAPSQLPPQALAGWALRDSAGRLLEGGSQRVELLVQGGGFIAQRWITPYERVTSIGYLGRT